MQRTLFLIFGLTLIQLSLFGQEYRTFDGSGNNLQNTSWGATHTQLKRATTVAYSDGIAAPNGTTRPNPRIISNGLFAQDSLVNDPLNLSDYVWVFGQFIDHDISLTGNSPLEPAFINVPAGDPWFDPFGQGTALIFMSRSAAMNGTGTSINNPREHANEITGWLDASNVYGSDINRANWLRTFQDGKMKLSLSDLLPFNSHTGNYGDPVDFSAPGMDDEVGISNYHFVAGDVRANENPLLAAFHTLFVREHNRLCDTLMIQHPSWNDEQLYQHARKIVGGQIQNIVYSEWLPTMGVDLPAYSAYDPAVDPRIMNVFSAAAFRMGHTLLNSTILRLDNDGNEIPAGNLQLQEAFFNPLSMIWTGGGIDPLFKGMATQVEQDLDCKVIDDVRNFLFGPPGAGGLDLASININRGRERGLPDFNTIRSDFGLTPYANFYELNPDSAIANSMQQLYGNINDVDAWVGMLAENKMQDALFGETIMEIMKVQFGALRDGDRFYFENDADLSTAEIDEIKNTNLHDIIMRNTNITLMQQNVFEAMPHNEICNPATNNEIAGLILTELNEEVSNVDLNLSNGTTGQTSSLGNFSIDVTACQEHTLTLSRTDNPANGLTISDIVKIQKHILLLDTLDNYQMVAADVNRSQGVSTFDMVHIRMVILGLVPDFPDGPSWLFLEDDFTFADPNNPLATPLPNNVYTFSSEEEILDMNFMAIKMGDVNKSVLPNLTSDIAETRNQFDGTLILTAEDQKIKAGEMVDVYLNPSEAIGLNGFQFTMNFEKNGLQFIDLESVMAEDFATKHFAVFDEEGAVTVAYNGDLFLEKNNSLLHFTFQALEDGSLSDYLFLNSRITQVEALSTEDKVLDIELNFNSGNANTLLSDQFKLYQNQPNPFKDATEISFFLPAASEVDLTIFDVSGRALTTLNGAFDKGLQTMQIEEKLFDQTGVFYYQLKTEFGMLTKKMVRVE